MKIASLRRTLITICQTADWLIALQAVMFMHSSADYSQGDLASASQ
jgi:hypothetical protein